MSFTPEQARQMAKKRGCSHRDCGIAAPCPVCGRMPMDTALSPMAVKPMGIKPALQKVKHKFKYKPNIVTEFLYSQGIPVPLYEYRFEPSRKWRFDLAWPLVKLAVELDGGIFKNGAHNRGARMKKTWERDNEATAQGWRILRCEPKELCMVDMARLIKRAMMKG